MNYVIGTIYVAAGVLCSIKGEQVQSPVLAILGSSIVVLGVINILFSRIK